MRNPTVGTAKMVQEELLSEGAIVIGFQGSQIAGSSYGINKDYCEKLGVILNFVLDTLLDPSSGKGRNWANRR